MNDAVYWGKKHRDNDITRYLIFLDRSMLWVIIGYLFVIPASIVSIYSAIMITPVLDIFVTNSTMEIIIKVLITLSVFVILIISGYQLLLRFGKYVEINETSKVIKVYSTIFIRALPFVTKQPFIWKYNDNKSEVHLYKSMSEISDPHDIPINMWKIILRGDNQEEEILQKNAPEYCGIMTDIVLTIANTFDLELIDHTGDQAIYLNNPIYNSKDDSQDISDSQGITGKPYKDTFIRLMMLICLGFLVLFIVIPLTAWNNTNLVLAGIFIGAFLIGFIFLYNDALIFDQFILEGNQLTIRKISRFFSYRSTSIDISTILAINSNIKHIEIIGIRKRIISYAKYYGDDLESQIQQLDQLICQKYKRMSEVINVYYDDFSNAI